MKRESLPTAAKRDSVNSLKQAVSKIEGWLTDEEGKLLYKLAKSCTGKGVIVEIGSYKGRSTIWLAEGSKAGNRVKVYAIDPHTGSTEHRRMYGKVWTFPEFVRNIKMRGLDDIVVPIVKTSEDAERCWNQKPVELLWIDGAHDYEMVKLDVELWFSHLVWGGWIAFHDSIVYPGPRKVVEELLKGNYLADVGLVDSITFGRKVKSIGWRDRLRNRYILWVKMRMVEYEKLFVSFLKLTFDTIVRLHLPDFLKRTVQKFSMAIDSREHGLPLYEIYYHSPLGRYGLFQRLKGFQGMF